MKNRTMGWIGIVLSTLSWQFSQAADETTPSQKAHHIAQNQQNLISLHNKLEHEAKSIRDARMQKDALSIIKTPTFIVVQANRKNEAEIIQKLKREGLFNSNSSLFPKEDPMPFIAASGSPWPGHHSYPGGLLYHTYSNLRLGLHYSEVYQEVYGVKLRNDYIRLASIWHDSAKTMTIPWNPDGSCIKQEVQIAGTSAHHIFGIAEAIQRKYPTDFIVVLASAHSPAFAGESLSALISYLKAAAIISQSPYSAAGLTSDGKALASLPPIEAFINHLDDHDYVLTQSSIDAVDKAMDPALKKQDYWKRNEILSKKGDLPLYKELVQKENTSAQAQ